MVKCSVVGCENRSCGKSPGVSFHRFPRKPELQVKWLHAIRRPKFIPSKDSRICSNHFNQNDINHTLGRLRLKDDACPFLTTFQRPDEKLRESFGLKPPDSAKVDTVILPSISQPETPKVPVVTAASDKDVIIIYKDKSLGISVSVDSESENKLINKLRQQNNILRRKLKTLTQKTRRQKNKIVTLKVLYNALIKKQKINQDNLNTLN